MTPGQVAYEAARDERLSRRPSDVVIDWGELNEGTRSMWEAAAQAVRRPLLDAEAMARHTAFGSAIADTDKRIAAGAALDAERRGEGISPIAVAVGNETGRWFGPDGKPCDHGHIWTMDDESGRYQCVCGKLMSKF